MGTARNLSVTEKWLYRAQNRDDRWNGMERFRNYIFSQDFSAFLSFLTMYIKKRIVNIKKKSFCSYTAIK